jgi:4-amino-4-deoxy-L-arabinose transferase-like glycosyltransferase
MEPTPSASGRPPSPQVTAEAESSPIVERVPGRLPDRPGLSRRLAASGLALSALAIYFVGRAPFLGQWDSFDYAKQIVTHSLSDLGFGRPVFIGCNVLIWEGARRLFRLEPLSVEMVSVGVVLLSAVAGVLLFRRLARALLPSDEARLATIAFLLSPLYALYAGYLMTEVPMLAVALGAAVVVTGGRPGLRPWRFLAAGVLFGAAVGIREQATMLAPAFVWLIWIRVPALARVKAIGLFGAASILTAAAPVLGLVALDPVRFADRMRVWLRAIPTGESHFLANVQATASYAFLLVPAAWLALLACLLFVRRSARGPGEGARIPAAGWGLFCCAALPLMALWRDADVQIHPRYALVVLPAVAIFSAAAFGRRLRSRRAGVAWVAANIVVYLVAQAAMQPFRTMQTEKRQFAQAVRQAVPGEALIIAGAYSPVFDYYRAVGVRTDWAILWSGWGWDSRAVESKIREAQRTGIPVYLCDGPWAWLYFEDERLDLHFLLESGQRQLAAPGLWKVRLR